MGPHDLVYCREIAILDVPPILAQMHRDAVGAGLLRDNDGVSWLWISRPTRLAKGCDVIDVHA